MYMVHLRIHPQGLVNSPLARAGTTVNQSHIGLLRLRPNRSDCFPNFARGGKQQHSGSVPIQPVHRPEFHRALGSRELVAEDSKGMVSAFPGRRHGHQIGRFVDGDQGTVGIQDLQLGSAAAAPLQHRPDFHYIADSERMVMPRNQLTIDRHAS